MVLRIREGIKYLCAVCIGGGTFGYSWAIESFHDYDYGYGSQYVDLESSHSDDYEVSNPLIGNSTFSDEDSSSGSYPTLESSSESWSESENDSQKLEVESYIFDSSTEESSSGSGDEDQIQEVGTYRFNSITEGSSSGSADEEQIQEVGTYFCDSGREELSFRNGDDEQNQQVEHYRFESSNDLISGLIKELEFLQSDAEAYIMCHTDLKTLIQKGDRVHQCLLRMKELSMAANSDLIGDANRNLLDIEFMAQSETIPMVLKLGSDQLSMGTDHKVLIFPDEQTIKIPTFKKIVDSLENLNMRTREEAVKAQDAVDVLLPKTAEIICDISAQADKVFTLIMMNDQLTQRAQERLCEFGF